MSQPVSRLTLHSATIALQRDGLGDHAGVDCDNGISSFRMTGRNAQGSAPKAPAQRVKYRSDIVRRAQRIQLRRIACHTDRYRGLAVRQRFQTGRSGSQLRIRKGRDQVAGDGLRRAEGLQRWNRAHPQVPSVRPTRWYQSPMAPEHPSSSTGDLLQTRDQGKRYGKHRCIAWMASAG